MTDSTYIISLQLAQLKRLRDMYPRDSFRKHFYIVFSDYPNAVHMDALRKEPMHPELLQEVEAMRMVLAE